MSFSAYADQTIIQPLHRRWQSICAIHRQTLYQFPLYPNQEWLSKIRYQLSLILTSTQYAGFGGDFIRWINPLAFPPDADIPAEILSIIQDSGDIPDAYCIRLTQASFSAMQIDYITPTQLQNIVTASSPQLYRPPHISAAYRAIAKITSLMQWQTIRYSGGFLGPGEQVQGESFSQETATAAINAAIAAANYASLEADESYIAHNIFLNQNGSCLYDEEPPGTWVEGSGWSASYLRQARLAGMPFADAEWASRSLSNLDQVKYIYSRTTPPSRDPADLTDSTRNVPDEVDTYQIFDADSTSPQSPIPDQIQIGLQPIAPLPAETWPAPPPPPQCLDWEDGERFYSLGYQVQYPYWAIIQWNLDPT